VACLIDHKENPWKTTAEKWEKAAGDWKTAAEKWEEKHG